MAERPIVQHWKCCVWETGPGVRIPLSPLKNRLLSDFLRIQGIAFLLVLVVFTAMSDIALNMAAVVVSGVSHL